MTIYWDLLSTFFKMGLFTFGGGYAMLPLLQREVVEKKKWATEAELMDYYAIGQSTPGIIAVNTASFVGYFQGSPGSYCCNDWFGTAIDRDHFGCGFGSAPTDRFRLARPRLCGNSGCGICTGLLLRLQAGQSGHC